MKLKRLVAGVLSAAMMLSVGSTLAFAADEDSTGTYTNNAISFSTTLNLSTDAYVIPDVTYSYTLTPDSSVKTVTLSDSTTSVPVSTATTTLEVTEANGGTVAFSNSDTLTTGEKFNSTTKTVTLSVSPTDLGITEAGFYVYELTQAIDTTNASDKLYTTDTDKHYVYLQVSYVETASVEALTITEVLIYESTTVSTSAKFVGFDNYYGVDSTGTSSTLTFQVEAYKFGSLANASKAFQYSVTATAGVNEGDVFSATLSTGSASILLKADEDGKLYVVESASAAIGTTDTAYTFELTEGDTFSIAGLIAGQAFSVTVKDSANDSYTAAWRTLGTDDTDWANIKVETVDAIINSTTAVTVPTYTMAAYDAETATSGKTQGIDFAGLRGTALKDDPTDLTYPDINLPETGVILEFAPFALMVLAAGAFISLRFVRATRKNEE